MTVQKRMSQTFAQQDAKHNLWILGLQKQQGHRNLYNKFQSILASPRHTSNQSQKFTRRIPNEICWHVRATRLKYNRMHGLVHGGKPSTQAFPYNGYDRLGQSITNTHICLSLQLNQQNLALSKFVKQISKSIQAKVRSILSKPWTLNSSFPWILLKPP